jgi:hypothetical protein
MEQDHVDLPPDRPEWWIVVSYESDLGRTCAELRELEVRVKVRVQTSDARRPPVHWHDQMILAFVRVAEIHLHRFAKAWMLARWRKPNEDLLPVTVGGPGAGSEQRSRVGEHQRPDLAKVCTKS